MQKADNSFWQERSIEDLAAEQGVEIGRQLEKVDGAGADLWENDQEFEQFVEGIQERRHEPVKA
jgi:hypothetical protein